ncbi:MAG: hypothetical protein U9R25_16215 [Chloroflexota bacterium]|nr:hypothetical protein [Chloroflexota bacterium]
MSTSDARGDHLLTVLRLFCLGLIGLHLVSPLFSEETAWGLWPITYLPPIWRWLLAGLTALACLPFAAGILSQAIDRLLKGIPPIPRNLLFLLIALLSIIPFTLFRIVHTRWGDAYILVNGIAYSDPALRLTGTWQAPLDVFLHVRLWELGNAILGWQDAWPPYRFFSPLAGVLYVYVLLRLADSIGQNRTEKLVIVGLVGSLGVMQLFFGYAENYSLAAVGILLFLWLALQCLQGQRPLRQPVLALAITNALHPSTVVLDPALLFVAWVWIGQNEKDPQRWLRAALQVAVPLIAVAGSVIVIMTLSGHGVDTLVTTDRPGGGDARWFVPLTEVSTRWEHYTMFSWLHVRDFLNEQVLTAPVTLGAFFIVIIALFSQRKDPASPRVWTADIVFLALCTGLYWLFTWLWNPDYGGQRDWDLFSLAAIPGTLLLARLLPKALPDRFQLAQAGLMLTAVSVMHTVAWIYQNTLPWEWT